MTEPAAKPKPAPLDPDILRIVDALARLAASEDHAASK